MDGQHYEYDLPLLKNSIFDHIVAAIMSFCPFRSLNHILLLSRGDHDGQNPLSLKKIAFGKSPSGIGNSG